MNFLISNFGKNISCCGEVSSYEIRRMSKDDKFDSKNLIRPHYIGNLQFAFPWQSSGMYIFMLDFSSQLSSYDT